MKNFRVMVVEDDPLFQITLEWALRKMDCTIEGMVDNSDDALRLLEGPLPDFILMDVSIKGGMDGLELGRKIRQTLRTPIIFLTAFEDSELYHAAMAIGGAGFLVKPFEVDTLRRTVHDLLAAT